MTTPASMSELSTTAASNNPAGSDAPSTIDDQIRALAAIVRQNVTKGTDIASASAITIPASGNYFVVTGTTTIAGISDTNSWYGREVELKFSGALTLTHSSGLIMPGAISRTTVAGDVVRFVSESSGVWRCTKYSEYTVAVNTFRATVASHATTADIWGAAGNEIDFTGTATITDFPDAPQAGVSRILHCAGACTFTNNANIAVQGAANYTAAAGDIVTVHAITTSTFRIEIEKADGTAVVGSSVITNTGSTTYLGADVTLNNTGTYFSGPNTGSIGASGQVWFIIATACLVNTAGASEFCVRIYDGSSGYGDTQATSVGANNELVITISRVVTLSGATTFTLQAKDALLTTGKLLTSGPSSASANNATSITAVRLS